ncbi:FG-GAP repeat protein [Streptomyces sp. TLI_185]|uniref:FG-GAP repeat protein n=1 Tax=Streptomyces sp. TLI_185 TaxID=2485151 RepID=UPI0037DA1B0B
MAAYAAGGRGSRRSCTGTSTATVTRTSRSAPRLGVVHGSAAGPDTSRTTVITQDGPGVPGATEGGDSFGSGISVGDVNGDGYADVTAGSSPRASAVWRRPVR